MSVLDEVEKYVRTRLVDWQDCSGCDDHEDVVRQSGKEQAAEEFLEYLKQLRGEAELDSGA